MQRNFRLIPVAGEDQVSTSRKLSDINTTLSYSKLKSIDPYEILEPATP